MSRTPLTRRRGLSAVLAVTGLVAEAACSAPPGVHSAPGTHAVPHHARAHTDVLYVGAHPDDEYQSLATFGQWRERHGLSTGVVTITRGEGGGNAVGPEEGAKLGMIRETEERRAVGLVGVRNVFYLDKPDFWYTLSAPLTARVWNGTDTLERLVRLIRATTPKTVVTMDPRPFNQHGGHQEAGRLAIEAFQLAADPKAFPAQITREGYRPWRPSQLLAQNWGFKGPVGPRCVAGQMRDPHTGLPVIGAWSGVRPDASRTTWAQVERNAARVYATQGFASLPATVDTPVRKLPCEWFTVLARGGTPVRAAVRDQSGLHPLYAEFRDWARGVGMPWLANDAQPDYPADPPTTVPRVAKAPLVDGRARRGEFPGPALRLTHWEGRRCSAADCAATVRLSRYGDALYVFFRVRDDKEGAALDGSKDCKRHWRTDSVEIDLDPRGDADDTSTTFKTGILPFTAPGGKPCAERDGDNRQGQAVSTAPGMVVASVVTKPYRGYTVEAKIPLRDLPAAVNPDGLAANFLLYDSDTQDETGRSRLAWSPYGSAQADPYVWRRLRLPGYVASSKRRMRKAVIPLEAAQSRDSPASVAQSRRSGVPLAAGPR